MNSKANDVSIDNHQEGEIPFVLNDSQSNLLVDIQKIIDMTIVPEEEEVTTTSYSGTYYAV